MPGAFFGEGEASMSDPHGTRNIPIGTPVVALNGELLGTVREVHPHYVLVHREGEHGDVEVPVHAIRGFDEGTLQISVNREALTAVDDEETAHRLGEER
ncbi:MAG: hypothetical protein QOF73_4836 [Thermomicrobiales bacterium]|jgi:hypothetical protein|nr:hypothetical protein [Thermomicrobiales bacterium]